MNNNNAGRFSSYFVPEPVKYHFKKEPGLYWKIRSATSRDELSMTTFATTEALHPGPVDTVCQDTMRYPNIIEIAWREIAILCVGTNIAMSDDDPTPALSNNPSVKEVENLLAQMPHEMVKEIWAALGEANPGWGPSKEKKAN